MGWPCCGVAMRGIAQKALSVIDSSGAWGCGALWSSKWIQFQWNSNFTAESIAVKELVPVVMAAAVWGHQWKGQVIPFVSNNEAVVQVLNAGHAREESLSHLLRYSCIIL